jgi:quinol monooxygenase YgiN
MRTYTATTVTVGSGQSIHWGSDCGTMCGAAHRSGRFTQPKLVNAETATCKRCAKIMAAEVEQAHAAALAKANAEEAHAEALNEAAQRRDDEERAAALAAPSVAYPGAVALDTWLTSGLVLVGPATDSLYVFERWDGGEAVLTHVDTNATERVAQADIVNWRYLPGVDMDEVCAVEVRKGDVIRFHAQGTYRTVSDVCHHAGTDLYSFSVEGAVTQYVRHASDLVARLDIPRR